MGLEFGDRLRNERVGRGLTQAELARDFCSPSYVSLLETGRREPTLEVIQELARRLGVPPKALRPRSQRSTADASEYVLASLYARQAWDTRDYSQAASHAATAARFALEDENDSAWWNMTFMRAECLMKQGQLAECERIARVLLEHPIIAESDGLAVRAHQILAAASHGLGRLDTAVEHAREAVRIGSQLPSGSTIYIGAVRTLIAALAESGRLDEAWDYCQILGSRVDDDLMGQLAGEVEWTIGNVAFMRAHYEEGVKHHERAAKLLVRRNDIELWARFNRTSAAARLSGGIVEPETLAAIERAELALSIVGGSRPEQLEVAFIRARWLYLNGEIPEVIERCRDIHSEKNVLGRHAAGEVALLFGRALKALGRNDEALELLKDAREQFSSAGASDKVQQTIDAILEIRFADATRRELSHGNDHGRAAR